MQTTALGRRNAARNTRPVRSPEKRRDDMTHEEFRKEVDDLVDYWYEQQALTQVGEEQQFDCFAAVCEAEKRIIDMYGWPSGH